MNNFIKKNRNKKFIVLDIPLFLENKMNKKNDVLIFIDDDGPGIPENERENVFKPFYKISKSRGDSKSSVGLGMSIASDMIQSDGGSIKLENSSLGGLRVKIFLPF